MAMQWGGKVERVLRPQQRHLLGSRRGGGGKFLRREAMRKRSRESYVNGGGGCGYDLITKMNMRNMNEVCWISRCC